MNVSGGGGGPLSADDIPPRRVILARLTDQTLSGGYNQIGVTVGRNDGLLSFASNVFTATADCAVTVAWSMYADSSALLDLIVRVNGTDYLQAAPIQASNGPYACFPVALESGDTLEAYVYSNFGNVYIVDDYAQLSTLIIMEA